ncbi:hypothetical protein JTB14_014376 [Gonioctena quinquepunctata]|nr:hypothetical protein JTB14_014376 [Gonioctena quinquepunctata]
MALKILSKSCGALNTVRYFAVAERIKMTTAGIIVIGDEILKGETRDTNSNYLAVELHKMGIRLKKISVIGDNIEEVSREVRYFSDSFDYVLTTGGIGPTHDDITYEAVAKAFDETVVLNAQLKEICFKFYNTSDVNYPGMKIAYIPKSAKLTFKEGIQTQKMTYPNVSINNIYILPGIPELMMKSFEIVRDVALKSKEKFHSKRVYLNAAENEILRVLNILVEEFPDVQFGSYPKLFHKLYKVKVTIESNKEESTRKAYEKLVTLLPKDIIVTEKIDK